MGDIKHTTEKAQKNLYSTKSAKLGVILCVEVYW